jgi:beta-galactosidase
MLYITSRRFTQRTAAKTDLKIYSNQNKVRVRLNGADLGERAVVDHIAIWKDVTLKAGPNHILAVTSGVGDVALSDAVDWTLAKSGGG